MSCSSRHIPPVECSKGRSRCSSSSSSSSCCGTVGDGTRANAGSSGRHASSSDRGSGMSARSPCGAKSFGEGLSGRGCAASRFGGGAPPVGFGSGSVVHFGPFGGGLGSGFGICNEVPLLSCNEKMTMQNLNDRLASYLDKVRSLEEENNQLEHKIKEWYDQQGALSGEKDYSSYYQQIEDLKQQIICATVHNSKLILDIDNSRITADDFKLKFETELALSQNVEVDVNGLRQVLDQLTLARSDLETELESLQEEMCSLRKNHEEEVKSSKSKPNGDVSVEVSSAPGPDLKKVLEDLRREYEAIIEENRREVVQWYECKKEELHREACNSRTEDDDCGNKLADLKSKMQTLGIELQAQIDLRDTLQSSLAETECRYSKNLAEIQEKISCVEKQLEELRAETESQNQEYKDLLDVKCRLEQEIQTYRCLLEGVHHDIVGKASAASGGVGARVSHSSTSSSGSHGCLKRVKLIDYEEK